MERSRPGPLLLKQWAKIAAIEEKESAIRKLSKHMQAMHDLANNATNIHKKKLKEDLAIAMSELKKLTRAKRPASSPPTESRTR